VFGPNGSHGDTSHGEAVIGGSALVLVIVATSASAANTNDRAPIIAGGVALFVAILTAVTTNRRQTRALAAERERLEMRLTHDRALVDVQDLRLAISDLLDSFVKWKSS
jgi:hypothetical protein